LFAYKKIPALMLGSFLCGFQFDTDRGRHRGAGFWLFLKIDIGQFLPDAVLSR